MCSLLAFEADRRVLNITINSFGTSLTKEQRAKLFPKIGRLYPAGNNLLARADDLEQVKQVCEAVPEYKGFFESSSSSGGGVSGEANADQLEDRMFKLEVQCESLLPKKKGEKISSLPLLSYLKANLLKA